MHQNSFGGRASPGPAGSAHSSPQTPYLNMGVPLRGREGKEEGRGKGRRGRGGEGQGEGEGEEEGEGEGKTREGVWGVNSIPPLLLYPLRALICTLHVTASMA
jgi:hypothetical protein